MTFPIRNLNRQFGELKVLSDLNFDIQSGAVNTILGPSGCGKTTILNILAGMDRHYSGSCGGVEQLRPSYVFQEDRLLPWLTAAGNVSFALRSMMDKNAADDLAMATLRSVGLANDMFNYPATLSGGMKRRVALARAFAYPADLLLLDEPFSALDLKTKITVMDSFLELHHRFGRTAVLVTHDVREAIYLGDTIVTLSEKPAVVRDVITVDLPKMERDFASAKSAELEARLYASILS